MPWQYHIEQWNIAERWSSKKQTQELENFMAKLNELGRQNWELVGYESVPLVGGITGNQKGYAYLCFLKRPAP